MLLREFINIKELEDVDLCDDLQIFMHNDPLFYRKIFYPEIIKVRDKIKSGKRCEETSFRSCVDKAADAYCEKFDVSGNPISVFTEVDRDKVARQIFAKERDNIIKGRYNRSEE
jgi:hypothetical protein